MNMKKSLIKGVIIATLAIVLLITPSGSKAEENADSVVIPALNAIVKAVSTYCSNPEHLNDCKAFIKQYNIPTTTQPSGSPKSLLPPPQTGGIDKVRLEEIVKAQGGPGGCKSMKECAVFCEVLANRQICHDFIVTNRLQLANTAVSPKITSLTKIGPGNCKGDECKGYCATSTHAQECIEYAVKNGLITKEEGDKRLAQLKVKKEIKDKGGPGGCKTDDECRAYCALSENQQVCIDFAKIHQILTGQQIQQHQEELRRYQEMLQQRLRPSASPTPAPSQSSSFTRQFVGLITQSFSDLSRQFFK